MDTYCTHISGQSIDDLMRMAISQVLQFGKDINPTKGSAKEIFGVILELTNPRARISRTETRGKPFSCLGEMLWYLAKRKDLDFISYYIPAYKSYAEDDEIFGAYGPRLFDWRGLNQVDNVVKLLQNKPDSRQAVIQLFDANDILETHKDIPCTCTLQFVIRQGKLHLFTNMRSNDVFIGLPHDVFCFTMIQEIMARSLAVEVGTYRHAVGSLHVYDKSMKNVQDFIDEGWQSTKIVMPPMPEEDPWRSIGILLEAEQTIRTNKTCDVEVLHTLDPYWADMARLLLVLQSSRSKDVDKLKGLRKEMSSDIYDPFIDRRIRQLS